MGVLLRNIPSNSNPPHSNLNSFSLCVQASAIFFVDLHMGVSPAPAPLSPPIPVIVDLGAGLTMVNWRAAQLVS
jgi:hypothetical protein